jgi:hypothetical protein
VLLSSLEGSAITQLQLTGAQHEFTTLPGVVEDVTDIVLEVYGRKRLHDVIYFRTHLQNLDEFPLKSGRQPLVSLIPDARTTSPDASGVQFTSERFGERRSRDGGSAQIARDIPTSRTRR